MKTTRTTAQARADRRRQEDEGYETLEATIRDRVGTATPGNVFTTSVNPVALWNAYLDNLKRTRRKHYNCHCCRRFIQRFGGLVAIDERGQIRPLLWSMEEVPDFFSRSIGALAEIVYRAKVTGVFVWGGKTKFWGSHRTGNWTHLSGEPVSCPQIPLTQTPFQAMAEKAEDFKVLNTALDDFPIAIAQGAFGLLSVPDGFFRDEKVKGAAEWFVKLHETLRSKRGTQRTNLLWRAVAQAPPGFCHVKNNMIGTLMQDIKDGLPMSDIKRRWQEKMHPLQYQRPTAAPKAGTIDRAEKIFADLGLAQSLRRRVATMDDVLCFLWRPGSQSQGRVLRTVRTALPGIFRDLREEPQRPLRNATLEDRSIHTVTWHVFQRDVLPHVSSMEVMVPNGRANFYGMLTAAVPGSPPIIQWDGLEGHPRNPASTYVYVGGSYAHDWNLTGGHYLDCTGICHEPEHWQEPEKFKHQGKTVLFLIRGCVDRRSSNLCLFPEILKTEFHEIRSVIEAHSKRGQVERESLSNDLANGLSFSKGNPVTVRVVGRSGRAVYTIDRME